MVTRQTLETAPQAGPGCVPVPDGAPAPPTEEPSADQTRERLTIAAMHRVARHGVRGTTVRDLARDAGTNVAAVNYHFGSKQALMNEAIMRIMLPVNRQRMALLAGAARDPATGAMELDHILDCLFRPVLESPMDGDGVRPYLRVLHHYRAEASASAHALIRETFDEAGRQFVDELVLALPDLPRAEVIWRYEMARGGILHILTVGDPGYLRRRRLDDGAPLMAMENTEAIMRQFIGCYLPLMRAERMWSDAQLAAPRPSPAG